MENAETSANVFGYMSTLTGNKIEKKNQPIHNSSKNCGEPKEYAFHEVCKSFMKQIML